MERKDPMDLYDTLAETLHGIGGILYGIETMLSAPGLYRERAIALAALGESMVQGAEQQAQRLYGAVQEHGRNGGGTPKGQRAGETAD